MDDSTDPTDRLLQRAADRLTGHPKRLFQAEVAVALCGGSARQAERRFGWGRDAVGTGLQVYPVAGAFDVARAAGARTLIVNAQPTPYDDAADAVFPGSISEVLPGVLGSAARSLN